ALLATHDDAWQHAAGAQSASVLHAASLGLAASVEEPVGDGAAGGGVSTGGRASASAFLGPSGEAGLHADTKKSKAMSGRIVRIKRSSCPAEAAS
ncbi:MAG TPA: hypothetical protein VM694_30645, partial [Polyangium sp.]|nr:hypothetical protein [Polyangium sp.]